MKEWGRLGAPPALLPSYSAYRSLEADGLTAMHPTPFTFPPGHD